MAEVTDDDAAEYFGFVVRYQHGEDVELKEHADASVVTLNVCLGGDFTDGDLVFGDYATPCATDGSGRSVL